eukprot:5639722-Pleurochrysis_carterae.AAC.1
MHGLARAASALAEPARSDGRRCSLRWDKWDTFTHICLARQNISCLRYAKRNDLPVSAATLQHDIACSAL